MSGRDASSSGRGSYSDAREKSILQEYLRSGECLIAAGSSELRDFWRFHTKYRGRLANSAGGVEALAASLLLQPVEESPHPPPVFPLPPYSIHLSCPLTVQRRMRDRRDQRQQDQRRQEMQVPESRVARHIIAAYLHFLQKSSFNKLTKLRQAQKSLPIFSHRSEILSTIQEHPIVIVAGDTGCGKSTQLPQYLLQQGYTGIVCTQPRRIACVSLCQRVSHETLQRYGGQIGYQIRFERQRTARTRVIFMTEGLLLRQVSADPMLSDYDVVVLDEVHERHLQGDFLLGVVKCLVMQRPGLRVVLMSATINIQLFQDYFSGMAPVIQIPGRLFPIKLIYRPIPAIEMTSRSGRLNAAPYVRVLSLIDSQYPVEERGDLLVFLSGIREITTVADACTEYATQNRRWIILPLHSSLPVDEQDKIFSAAPDGVRKCIVSTNIAETSVTIDGVRFVLDSGRVKEMSYDSVSRMQRLKEFWVSQASAEQRKGRAGRTGPGVCFRLYSEEEFGMLSAYSKPEVQRVPLESLVLQTASMGLANVRKFPFVDRPPEDSLESAVQSLIQQGALTKSEQLTPLGQMLSRLPVDVTVGKMLVMGSVLHQIGAALTVAAALSVQSPLTNRAFRDTHCLTNLRPLFSSHGDAVTLLQLFTSWLDVKLVGQVRTRRWCTERGVEEQRLFELVKLRKQFVTILEESRLLPKPPRLDSGADRIRRHGELAQLRTAKRKLREAAPTRRVLRVESGAAQMPDANDAADDDLNTLDFHMRTDNREMRELLTASRLDSYRDMTLLKVILCSGLYPNFAVPDLHNSYKPNADQIFHAPNKPFVVLHPNSSLAFSPGVLEITNSDVAAPNRPRHPRHFPVSNKHQLLAFVTLLETVKPYVTNVLRVPALHTALLFCNKLETSATFDTLCCDQWLEFVLNSASEAQQLVSRVITLRSWWHKLLKLQLNEMESSEAFEADEVSGIRRGLVEGLVELLQVDVFYSYRRLLPADLSDGELYLPPDDTTQPAQLPDFIRFSVLRSDDVVSMQDCVCPYCEQPLSVLPLDRVLHWSRCIYSTRLQQPASASRTDTAASGANGGAGDYYCPQCEQPFAFSAVQILQHKRKHQSTEAGRVTV